MKKLIFIACFFLAVKVTAQGNLQFNQVLTYSQQYASTYVSGTHSYSSSTYQVPTGKVWKVEKFVFVTTSGPNPYLKVNNTSFVKDTDVNAGPVWLKSGDQISVYSTWNNGISYTINGNYFISIIEFNIIP
jgi:hypothetical protein